MPAYVKRNPFKTVHLNKRTGLLYSDKLCFFCCLKCHKNMKKVKEYLNMW